jgi:predicted nucleic acid-binding Zn ribbon protein
VSDEASTGRDRSPENQVHSAGEPELENPVTPFSTNIGGKDADSVDNSSDPVKTALSGAQRISRGKPVRTRRRRRTDDADTRVGGYSGAGPDATDPQPVGAVVASYLSDRGWERPLAEARVFSDWPAIVGADVATHCAPSALRDGELKISAESTAWATQLRMLAGTLLARIVAELGPEVVTRVVITGPVGPSWKHGLRSVHGARGPRDTYG